MIVCETFQVRNLPGVRQSYLQPPRQAVFEENTSTFVNDDLCRELVKTAIIWIVCRLLFIRCCAVTLTSSGM